MDAADKIQKHDVVLVLQSSKDENVKKMSTDAGLVVSLTKFLNSVLKFAEEKKVGSVQEYRDFIKNKPELPLPNSSGAGAVITGMAATYAFSGVIKNAAPSDAVLAANLVAGQAAKTASLVKLIGKTPTQAVAGISLTVLEKTVMAAGMQDKYKCELAVTSLAATAGLSVVAGIPTGPIGWTILAIALGSEIFNTYDKCMIKQ